MHFVKLEQSSVLWNNGIRLVSKILSVALESNSATWTTILTLSQCCEKQGPEHQPSGIVMVVKMNSISEVPLV